jgi:hypothetical protein
MSCSMLLLMCIHGYLLKWLVILIVVSFTQNVTYVYELLQDTPAEMWVQETDEVKQRSLFLTDKPHKI